MAAWCDRFRTVSAVACLRSPSNGSFAQAWRRLVYIHELLYFVDVLQL